MDRFYNSEHVVRGRAVATPILCHRPHAAQRAAAAFVSQFPGTVVYAVKANPAPHILQAVADGGIAHFDVASLTEIRDARAQFPKANLAFMHPVKSPEAIAEAYADHGVRTFALDSEAELHKILQATGGARDLTLCVRLGVENPHAKMSLARKFGAREGSAVGLLSRTRLVAARLGISFHVGSQTMAPAAFAEALDAVESVVTRAGVVVDVLDVGGGFPARYPGMEPPALPLFFDAIAERVARFPAARNAELWCEPGRALCAEAASLLVRVEARRDQDLYINDGTYGALLDAGQFAWRYPVRALNGEGATLPFRFYGPTCDDADFMPGPFFLPASTDVGDVIEIGMLGAYGQTMASRFNGYGRYEHVLCQDDPFGTLYGPASEKCRTEANS